MLYSIIPPILIILSLVGIILFLMKKSPKIAKLEEADLFGEGRREHAAEKIGFFRKNWLKIKNVRWNKMRHFVLVALEKATRKFRVIFLKLEARFGNWSNNIKNRRNKKAGISQYGLPAKEEDSVIKKLEAYELKKKKRMRAAKENILLGESEEKKIKPIISEKVIAPQTKAEIKDKLEELLIERIAVNPKDVEAYERLGEYYLEIKSFDFAKECFKQVIKLDPSNRNVRYKMRKLENLLQER